MRPPTQYTNKPPVRVLLGVAVLTLWAFSASCSALNAAVVILNEYNAVQDNRWLDQDGQNASTRSDTYLGRIEGNGGDWFELVVVGDGTAGSTVDMRGWELRIDHAGGINNGHLKLSDHGYWSDVRAGTILTFIETEDADGIGNDTSTEIHKVNNFATEGWAWSNIFVDDNTYIDTGHADHDPGFPISDLASQFAVFDADGVTSIFGPAGEGISPVSGVGTREIFKLEASPSPSILATSGSYNDGTSSTFGAPNVWSSGTTTQNFTAFVPEPGTFVMLAVGGVVLLLAWCRRRRSSATAR